MRGIGGGRTQRNTKKNRRDHNHHHRRHHHHRAAQKKQLVSVSQIDTTTPTRFIGYENLEATAKVLELASVKENDGSSILDNLRRLNPELSANAAHAALARFAFRNRAALQIAATLSGGERLRAGLACVFARPQPPFLLLLDEPTNHLDLASIEQLENALQGFDGALIAVSHDEPFLRAIGIGREIVLG